MHERVFVSYGQQRIDPLFPLPRVTKPVFPQKRKLGKVIRILAEIENFLQNGKPLPIPREFSFSPQDIQRAYLDPQRRTWQSDSVCFCGFANLCVLRSPVAVESPRRRSYATCKCW
jgi:hypothetical protein